MTVGFVPRLLLGSFRRCLADPVALFSVAVIYLAVCLTIGSLWKAGAEAGGGQVVGYSTAALVWYIVATEAGTVSVVTRLIELLGDDIASGRYDADLLRPRSPLAVRVLTEVGMTLGRLLPCLALGAPVALLLVGPPPDPLGVLLAAPSLILAVTVNVVTMHAFGSLAFWFLDARTSWFIYQKCVFILGGMLLPLEVMPDGLAAVARALPFMAMAYAPGRLASGHRDLWLFGAQIGWLVVLWLVASALFARGERRLARAGA